MFCLRRRAAHSRGMPVRTLAAAFLLLAASPAAIPAADARFERVTVEPVTTSIFIGHVTLTAPVFVRGRDGYTANYRAAVFPFFFWSESGRLTIEAGDDDLQRLQRGETVAFRGHAENANGESRRIEGRAVPEDVVHGKLKIRIFVSRRIQLIFNTTYRFTGGP